MQRGPLLYAAVASYPLYCGPFFCTSYGAAYGICQASWYEYSRRPPENGTAGRGDIHTNAIGYMWSAVRARLREAEGAGQQQRTRQTLSSTLLRARRTEHAALFHLFRGK